MRALIREVNPINNSPFDIFHNGKHVKTFYTGWESHAFCKSECLRVDGYHEFLVFHKGFQFASFNADDVKLSLEREQNNAKRLRA